MPRTFAAHLKKNGPEKSLTISRCVNLLEDGERGAYADLQWAYRAIEMQDATLGALIERRTSAIQKLDWDIKLSDKVPAGKEAVAERQRAALQAAYERIGNLSAALEFLAMASFRGFAHLEKVTDQHGDIVELAPVEQWFWVREGIYGTWELNREMKPGATKGDTVPLPRFITREVARPINRVALICFVRKGLSQKDWDAFVETYGIPAVFVIMPPDVPKDEEAKYLATADQVASDTRGVLPHGSDVKTVDSGARGNNPFADHIAYQDAQIVLRGTGGLLTMLTQSGSGTLAGGAHADTFDAIAKAEAAEISETLRKQLDAEILARVTPGERAYAYFALAANEETDTKQVVADVVALAGAGYRVSAEHIAEKTGYEVEEKEAGKRKSGNAEREEEETATGDHRHGEEAGGTPALPSAVRNALVKDRKPLLDAIFNASRAGDEIAMRAALRKISRDIPGMLDAPTLEETLADQMIEAWGGQAGIRNTMKDGIEGEWRMYKGRRIFIRATPRHLTPEQADRMLEKGFSVRDAEGTEVRFGNELKSKLDKQADGGERKKFLLWAREAVRTGDKKRVTVKGEARDYYGKIFKEETSSKGVLVIVDADDGYAFNLHPIKPGKLKRKLSNNERLGSGEQPPPEVLQAFAPLLALLEGAEEK